MALQRRWARGGKAWGHCARSGKKMLLKGMVEDGYFPGILVAPEEYDPPHPQEFLQALTDPESLQRPAPDLDVQKQTSNAVAFGIESRAFVINDDSIFPGNTDGLVAGA